MRLYFRFKVSLQQAAAELWQIYSSPIVVIPTNRPCARKALPDIVFASSKARWQRVLVEVQRIHESGRPVLIGTRSVRDSEYLSGLLAAQHLDHQVLNAVRHREEAQIVAAAGQPGKITVATNMAGRGTDIKLAPGVGDKGGLHVIATELHDSGRIDRQLYGRCGRQGDQGSCEAILAIEDDLVTAQLGRLARYLRVSGGLPRWCGKTVFSVAQSRAERTHSRMRRDLLDMDEYLGNMLAFSGRGE